MTETAVAAAPAAAKKVTKSPSKAAARTKSHPVWADMITNAVKALNERGGSSVPAIKKYIYSNNSVDPDRAAQHLKRGVKSALAAGNLVQVKGKGLSGSFKLGAKAAKPKKAVAAKPKVKKAAAGSKSPKKATATKKKSPAKKAASPKKPKAATAKPKKVTAAKPAPKPRKAPVAKTAKPTASPKPPKASPKKVKKAPAKPKAAAPKKSPKQKPAKSPKKQTATKKAAAKK